MKKSSSFSERHKKTIEKEALKTEILSEIKEGKSKSKKSNISHDVQILILHYLGIGKELTNVHRAKLFAPIMNRNEDVTRQKLSSIETFKTEKNLYFLLKYFESVGFEAQLGTIKKELEKKK